MRDSLYCALILLFAFSSNAGAMVADGVVADGIFFAPNNIEALSDWSDCTGVVAYWTMDSASGLDASAGSCASGTDCDLSDPGSAGYVTGIRGNAKAMTLGQELTCGVSSSCFPSGDISIVGWEREGSGGFEIAFLAGNLSSTNIFLHSNGGAAVNGDTVSVFESVESATQFGFLSLSYDDSADTLIGCGSDLGHFAWGCVTNSSATAGNPGGGSGFCYPVANGSACDEVAVFDVALTEEELCRICSCWLDGSNCKRSGTHWVDTGLNNISCGNCPLPSDPSATCF